MNGQVQVRVITGNRTQINAPNSVPPELVTTVLRCETASTAAELAQGAAEDAQEITEAARDTTVAAKDTAVNAAGAAAVSAASTCDVAFPTKVLMDADLAHAANTLALVTNDSTNQNNGLYIKSGASGSGSWAKSLYDPLAYSKPFILPGLVLPNYDTATKTLSFNSDATYKCMLFYRNTVYQIPVGTNVVDGNGTTAVQLVFDTATNEFSFIPYSTALTAVQIRVAVYKRLSGFYQWDFPCGLTINNKPMMFQNQTEYSYIQKALAIAIYIGYGKSVEIVEDVVNTKVYFRITDGGTLEVRPTAGYSISKSWETMLSEQSAYVVDINGTNYLSIDATHYLVINGRTGTIEIVAAGSIIAGEHLILVGCSGGGRVYGLYGHIWFEKYCRSLNEARISTLETALNSLPDYVSDQLTVTRESVLDMTSPQTVSLIFITDAHADGGYYAQAVNHFRAVAEFTKSGAADFVVFGGDLTSGVSAAKADNKKIVSELITELIKSKVDVFPLRGNHDDNSYYATTPLSANVVSMAEWWARMVMPCKNQAVHDSQNANSTYYYKDLAEKKIRIVCLDSIDYPVITNESDELTWSGRNFWGFGARQCTWLATEALVSIPSGYKVVVLSHIPTRSDLNYGGSIPKNGNIIEGLLLACHSGATYSGETAGTDYDVSVSVDYASQGSRPILAYIHGHTHADLISKPADLGWNYVSVPNSYSVAISSDYPSGATVPSRTAGTVTEDCWDVITINTSTGAINCTRYGAGDDRSAS